MPTTDNVISKKMELLVAEQGRFEAEIKAHSKRLEGAKASLRIVEEKLSLLRELASELDSQTPIQDAPVSAPPVMADTPAEPDFTKLKPAEAVRELLRMCPDGLTQHHVVSELHDKIASDSIDKKRLLYNTIFNLKKRGLLREVEVQGRARLFLNEARPGEHVTLEQLL